MVEPDATLNSSLLVQPVSITMVTYNRAEFTRRSIDSIVKTAGHPYELTVVDNGSRDGTVDLLEDLHARGVIHRLLLNPVNKGVAYAANQGWASSRSAYHMKVDNDIVFTKPSWLAPLVAACDRLPDVGAIGYNFETTSYPVRVVGGVRVRPKNGNIGGACVMIPDRVHREVGYWCEDYFPYGEEDHDMYVRLKLLRRRSYYMEDEDVGLHLPEGKASPLLRGGRESLYDEGDPAYRAEKDQSRATHVGWRGRRRINEGLYRHGMRPLFVEHGVPYTPGTRARVYALVRFLRLDPWWAERS